ncbi:DUF1707 domain-containing protein [Mycobacterium sp. SMC-2]|uniref:DUF1707 SHOCT-like domain-containing protein n=1 Tax=Mycobacterium sp. SMC-2 TaxID=2857058 RepID=UPI0021B20112|nr:DUF1707 domain-containing protein [Mycobacterium sp. SMC-2]UXA05928.1 DUF1707 domain-containing protein [Mycobacterium sp. SMC-2]
MSNSAQRDAKDTSDESSRAADTDRIQLAQLLAYAVEQGRLQLKDYEDRLARAYAATTYEELDQLRADLPGSPINPRRGGTPNPAPSTLLLALLSGFERRGRWNVPKKLTTFTLWGNGVVDLRYADFTSTEVDIHAMSIMGMTNILLPPEVNVEIHGRGVMGNFDRSVLGQGTPGAPKVRIHGWSLWGGVGIKRRARRRSG